MMKKESHRYRVYYMKPDHFRTFITGLQKPDRKHLNETHVELRDLEASSLGAVFSMLQGEIWSPQGEARSLIKMKKLGHTSMSVGDVVEDLDSGEMFACARLGWDKI